jgi:hypothetical protein
VNRHTLCAFLLIFATACRGVDGRAFAGVDRASSAVRAAVDSKAPLAQYRERLSVFSAEVSALRPHVATPRERAIAAEYEAALKSLTDFELVWEEREARGSDMLPIREPLPARIAREYQLGVNTNEPPSIYADEALQAIWDAAQGHLRAAHQS